MNAKLILGLLAVVILTLVPAIVDGQRRFRWGEDDEIVKLSGNLGKLPMQIGDWECTTEKPLDATSAELLTPIASINRVYLNRRENLSANLFILLGPTGPTAVHTPDICFNSREFKKLGARKKINAVPSNDQQDSTDSNFFRTEFKSRDINESGLKSIYGWTIDGQWSAAEQPRFEFSRSRYLFKIQATSRFESVDAMKDSRALEKLVSDVETILNKVVF